MTTSQYTKCFPSNEECVIKRNEMTNNGSKLGFAVGQSVNYTECSKNDNNEYCFTQTITEYDTYGGSRSHKKIRKGSLESNFVAELRAKCIKRGIKYSGLCKAELIAVLRKKN